MQTIDWHNFSQNRLPLGKNTSSMTVGVFDGVHLGHQALIKRIVSHTDKVPVAVTFKESGHKCEKTTNNIQTFEEKAAALESLGIEILVVVDFSESFRRMKGIQFLETLLKNGSIGFFAVGGNFRCGYKLDTDASAVRDFFTANSIPVEIVSEVMHGSQPISSSRIRSAIASGYLREAEEMLGCGFSGNTY